MSAEFVNPYTFVPLPERVDRRAPAGHHQSADGSVSGRMSLMWTLLTPLLLPEKFETRGDRRVVVPGSAVKGAVRALHEALMGSCLRVVDTEYVPVYREPTVAKPEAVWRLAVVAEHTQHGRATKVLVSETTVWLPIDRAALALGGLPQSGDAVGLEFANDLPQVTGLGRRQVGVGDRVVPGESWVLMVGDSGTRAKSREFFVAAGDFGGDCEERTVPEAAWDDYTRVCDGANDLRLIKQKLNGNKGWREERIFAPVVWKGGEVGRRRVVTGRLWKGDVVWVKLSDDGQTVERLSMAAIWRTSGVGGVGERIPEATRPCDDPALLCVSCRVFGSADVGRAEPGEAAEQRGYAGHVRFGDAVTVGAVALEMVRLAPMGAPRPGTGQFYLKHTDNEGALEPAQSETELPGAAWGSRHDSLQLRQLAGRKFYWHGDPAVQTPPRHIARGKQGESKMSGDRWLVPAGTVLMQNIVFDNILPTELASVLLTLMPQAALPVNGKVEPESDGFALHLGGGKPLGLGTCGVEVDTLTIGETAGRYAGRAAVDVSARDYLHKHRGDVARMAGSAARRHWPVLSRVLRRDGVAPEAIWYPLGGDWGDQEKRDQSYVFFARTNGRFLKRSTEPIVPLPSPSDESHPQTLRLPPKSQPRNGRR